MTRIAGFLFLVALTVFVAACSQPGDEPGTKLIAVIEKHGALVKEGKFNADDFKKETQPLVDALKPLKSSDGKVPMSTSVKEKWDKAVKDFVDICKDKTNLEAMLAFAAMGEEIAGKKMGDEKKDK